MNTVAISGNLTRDPELRTTAGGTDVCNVGLAWEKRVKDGDEWVGKAQFFELTVWSGLGKMFADKARKGDRVFVQGELEQSSWETEGGEKRSKVVIVARDVDGEWKYRKRDEVPAASAPTASQPAAPVADDDDIPF